MSEYWHEPTNPRLLAVALMATQAYQKTMYTTGEAIHLWDNRWTFSYYPPLVEANGTEGSYSSGCCSTNHEPTQPEDAIIHWHSSLEYYWSKEQAEEAMRNFVSGLNAGMRRV